MPFLRPKKTCPPPAPGGKKVYGTTLPPVNPTSAATSEEDLPAAGPSSSASSSLPSTPQPPPPTHVHGLVGTCSYELYGGLQLCGGMVPQQHAGQHPPCQIPVFSSSSSLRTVFFPLAHPLHLDVSKPTCLDISVFRTVCGANDVYYFWFFW